MIITKDVYAAFDFTDENIWLEMLGNRNDMTHIYDGGRARELAEIVIRRYIPEFQKMEKAVSDKYRDVLENI